MDTKGHEIGRREFLLVSATGALAGVTVGPQFFGAVTSLPSKRLAVAFASFDAPAGVMTASSVPAGDGRFIGRGACITVAGASGAPANPRARRSVELLAHYSYFEGAERRDAPFRAWACNRSTGCQGNGVSFNVPVDVEQRIRLSVGVETDSVEGTLTSRRRAVGRAVSSGSAKSESLPVTLSLLSDPTSLKLARGFYVLVPLFENDAEPRWSSFVLARLDGRWTLQDRDGNAAQFEHFVLRIDYAS